MKRTLRAWLLLSLLGITATASAQYYSWGADRASLRWSRVEGDRVSVIYPDSVDHTARRIMHYLDAVSDTEAEGFKYPALELPFVVHPDNFASNGMVMWAPLRVEFLSTPAIDSYSMPWVKQLVAHEYRHAVQYSNLDRSTLKWASYFLGEQGAAASLLFPPLYALEGDAVMIETAMSSYGRGLQPSFTMGYRAQDPDELLDQRNFLKWRCGSYLEFIPDHYRMGYQMMTYAYTKYDENILDAAFAYTARNPQFISPYSIALRKFYDTSTKELFYETFAELVDFWQSSAEVANSAEQITADEARNFISYSYPVASVGGKVLMLREDYKEPTRFLLVDPATAEEQQIAHTGSISTRPSYAAGRVWWSEYRRSKLYNEDVNSLLCYMDLDSGRAKSLKGRSSGLYPTPIGESTNHIAYVEYNMSGQYSVVELLDNVEQSRVEVTYPNEVHGLAWDSATQRLYTLITGDEGMWIEQLTDAGFERLTEPAYITLSSLAARDGVLYFGSIASGKDEVHSLDIATGVERQLTESTYGAFNPAPIGDELYVAIYNRYGYHLARQNGEESIAERSYSQLPDNVVNPARKSYDVVNLDTVRLDAVALRQAREEQPSRKYHKAAHLVNFHSWAPIRYNPLTILSEQSLDIGLGVTLASQNLLSSCEGYLSYGWDHYEGSVVQGGFSYNGLGVVLDLSATYGGEQKQYLVSGVQDLDLYRDLTFSVTLPLYFARGYRTRTLSLYSGWNYSNGIVPEGLSTYYKFSTADGSFTNNLACESLREGLNKLSVGATYSDFVRSSVRDVATPWGYVVSGSLAVDPANSEFSKLGLLYGELYTPGFAQNNSLILSAAFQNAFDGFDVSGYRPLSYLSSALIPHGFTYSDITNNNYLAASANYRFPLCYPELSLLFNKVYIKRLTLGVGADYASFNNYNAPRSAIYSYGATLSTDLNAISMTSASTLTISLSLYKPQDRPLYFQFGFSMPL